MIAYAADTRLLLSPLVPRRLVTRPSLQSVSIISASSLLLSIFMAAIPSSMFMASKVHQSLLEEREGDKCSFGQQELPHYNDKLMNSIWGLYNRYAPHAFQKNNEPERDMAPGAPCTQIRYACARNQGLKYELLPLIMESGLQ